MNKLIWLMVFIINPMCFFGQATIWSENFDNPACCIDGTGIDGTGNIGGYPGSVSWTLDASLANFIDAGDFIKTHLGTLEATDVDGTLSSGGYDAIWYSGAISVVGYTGIQFSLDAIEVGDHEATDYFDVYYSIDGGAYTLIVNWNSKGSATHTLIGDIPTDADWGSEVVSVTGLTASTLQIKVVMSNNAGVEHLRLDNVLIQGWNCILASEPTIAPSGLTFSSNGCNGMTLKWTAGNGSRRMVVMKAGSTVTGTPIDQTTYTADANFGVGSTIAAEEYVVHKGTVDSVNIYGLSASTTYYVKIFELNGANCQENYFTTSTLTGNSSTGVCNTCPSVTALLINACEGTCAEGDNEMVFFDSGDYMIPVTPADITFLYGSTNPPTTTYTDAFTASATATSSLNTSAACGTVFYDASVKGTIPPHTKFVLTTPNICASAAYDFSSFCGAGPVYVIYSTDPNWIAGGNFANSTSCSGGIRYLRSDFSSLTGGCIVDYNWTCASVTGGNGDIVTYNPTGGAPISYLNTGCAPPLSVLPIELLSFNASVIDERVKLSWVTASEINNDFFTVERSRVGLAFKNIGVVDGSGTSNNSSSYSLVDYQPYNGTSYYRLRQTDYNGGFSLSPVVAVSLPMTGDLSIGNIQVQDNSLHINLYASEQSSPNVVVIDVTGRQIYNDFVTIDKHVEINISNFTVHGLYFVRVLDKGIMKIAKFAW